MNAPALGPRRRRGPRGRALRRDAPCGGLRRRARARRRGAGSPYERPALSKEFLAGQRERRRPAAATRVVLGRAEDRARARGARDRGRPRTKRPRRRAAAGCSGGRRSSSPPAPGHGGSRSHRRGRARPPHAGGCRSRSARSSSREQGSRSSAAGSWAPRSPRPPARSGST